MSRISIVGTGYVGLVTGLCLADRGHDVTCIDVDRDKVDAINAGRPPFFEKGLDELLARHAGHRLQATTDLRQAVLDSELTFIAVGTPAADGRIDLSYVLRAATEIGGALAGKQGYHVVVVKSTVIPGSTDGPIRSALESASGKQAGRDFGLGMNPEFLTEGRAIEDFMHPDRLVLGGIDERSRTVLAGLYSAFADAPRVFTNNATAEMIKYASNAVLATMISFANEIGRLCNALPGVDVAEVMEGVHCSAYFTSRPPGVSPVKAAITSFLEAGCGFGGSCLPKDVTALAAQGRSHGLAMPLLHSVLEVNRSQPEELIRLITRSLPDLGGVRVTVLGIAFKPDTDDMRESPAFPVLRRLRELGAQLTAYDPVAWPEGHESVRGVRRASSLRDALVEAEVVVIVTRWDEFKQVPAMLRDLARTPLLVDGRRMLPPGAYARYEGIGRGHA